MDYETNEYKVRDYGDITVVRLKNPNFTGTVEVMQVNEELKAMVDQGVKKLVVCFKHVDHCGSAGLGMLIGLNKKLSEGGGGLVISHSEKIEELLRISRTASLFKLAPDPKVAMKMF